MTKPIVSVDAQFDSFDWVGENKMLVQMTVDGEARAIVPVGNVLDASRLAFECINDGHLPATLRATGMW
jgi:hypothetical protein